MQPKILLNQHFDLQFFFVQSAAYKKVHLRIILKNHQMNNQIIAYRVSFRCRLFFFGYHNIE